MEIAKTMKTENWKTLTFELLTLVATAADVHAQTNVTLSPAVKPAGTDNIAAHYPEMRSVFS